MKIWRENRVLRFRGRAHRFSKIPYSNFARMRKDLTRVQRFRGRARRFLGRPSFDFARARKDSGEGIGSSHPSISRVREEVRGRESRPRGRLLGHKGGWGAMGNEKTTRNGSGRKEGRMRGKERGRGMMHAPRVRAFCGPPH